MHTQSLGVRLLENSLEFRPRKWAGKLLGAGCYPYAANFYCEQFIRIGELIGKPCDMLTPDYVLIFTLLEELLYLGYKSVKEVQTDYILQPGESKIYLRRVNQVGIYHLFRQNSDGLWSHKYKNKLPSERDSNQELLYDPAKQNPKEGLSYNGWCFLLNRD